MFVLEECLIAYIFFGLVNVVSLVSTASILSHGIAWTGPRLDSIEVLAT